MHPHCPFLPLLELATSAPLLLSGSFASPLFVGSHSYYCIYLPGFCFKMIPAHFPESPFGYQHLYFLNSHPWSQQDVGRKAFHSSAVERALDQRLEARVLIPLLPPAG